MSDISDIILVTVDIVTQKEFLEGNWKSIKFHLLNSNL